MSRIGSPVRLQFGSSGGRESSTALIAFAHDGAGADACEIMAIGYLGHGAFSLFYRALHNLELVSLCKYY